MRHLCFALLLASSACSHVSAECTAHQGSVWTQLKSAHFTLSTNLPVDEARPALLELELSRAAILPILQGTELTGAPIDAVLFAEPAQLLERSGSDDASWVEDWKGPLLLLTQDTAILASNPRLERLLHELTHLLAARVVRRLPRWVAEGLATYFEMVNVDAVARTARRGRAHQQRLGDIERWGLLPIEALWAWTQLEHDKPGLEQHRTASAWFWVYWLLNEHRSAFEGFIRSLAHGEEPGFAWKKAFPTLTTQGMADASTKFRAEGRSTGQALELSGLEAQVTVRELEPAHVHVLRSRMAAAVSDWQSSVREADVAASLAADDVMVLEQRAATRPSADERVSTATALTERDATRMEGWLLLGLSTPDAQTREGALLRVLELDPTHALASALLASSASARGETPRALDLARRSFQSPSTPRALSLSADVLERAGLCGEALTLEWRALELLPHRLESTLSPKLHQRLDALAACARR